MTPLSAATPACVLIAPDKFKGTLTSLEAAAAMERGLRRAWPHVSARITPLADGGEGFSEALVMATNGKLHRMETSDALGRACSAGWVELGDGQTAAFDLAAAAGLAQLAPADRNPLQTSTWGSGVVLRELVARGYRRILIGLGGSATNDGGIGLAAALGYQFLDPSGREIPLTGAGLGDLFAIKRPTNLPNLELIAATDVDNPLTGANGAARAFAPQKGATDADVERLDANLHRLAECARQALGFELHTSPGSGAAGGAGFGLLAFLGAQRRSGFDVLREYAGLDTLVLNHDLILTGEGRLDATSLDGKGPVQLACLARKHQKRAWGVFGQVATTAADEHFDRWAALPHLAPGEIEGLPRARHAERLEAATYELARG